ncbi:MAG: hypothetical protein ACE5PO_06800 [Candidatus Bathyarchaeia archaeon]
MSVKLIFSFDSEDYETPAADDAEKWWAEAMSRHGIKACTCVVGELARALRSRARRDVIEAMSKHEIAFHANMHSAHPTWAEYLDECGWDDGVERVMREESKGIRDVRDVFGQHPSAWCKPGSSWGPQVAYAMTLMDVPVSAIRRLKPLQGVLSGMITPSFCAITLRLTGILTLLMRNVFRG